MKLSLTTFCWISSRPPSLKIVKLPEEVLDTTDRVEETSDELLSKNSLQIINQQKEVIKEYQEDLTYKFKVLEKDLQARLVVIKELSRN